MPKDEQQDPGKQDAYGITPDILQQRTVSGFPVILLHVRQHQRHVEHEGGNGIGSTIADAEGTLRRFG